MYEYRRPPPRRMTERIADAALVAQPRLAVAEHERWTLPATGETFVYPLSALLADRAPRDDDTRDDDTRNDDIRAFLVMFRINNRSSVAPFLEFALSAADLAWIPLPAAAADGNGVRKKRRLDPAAAPDEEEEDEEAEEDAAVVRALDEAYARMGSAPGDGTTPPRMCGVHAEADAHYYFVQVYGRSAGEQQQQQGEAWVTVHDLKKTGSLRGRAIRAADLPADLFYLREARTQAPAEIPSALEAFVAADADAADADWHDFAAYTPHPRAVPSPHPVGRSMYAFADPHFLLPPSDRDDARRYAVFPCTTAYLVADRAQNAALLARGGFNSVYLPMRDGGFVFLVLSSGQFVAL